MHNPLRPLRVAILCSFNLDLMTRPLEGLLKQHLFQPHLYLSAYGQWEIDPLNSDSDLYQFAPDIVLLFAEFSDLMPTANRDGMLPLAEEAQALGQDAWSRVEAVLHSLLQFLPSHTQILCHNLLAPQVSSLGLLEGNAGYSLVTSAETFNQNLRDRVREESRLFGFDYAGLVTKHGWQNWSDSRLWHLGRMRLSRTGIQLLTHQYTRYIKTLFIPRRKCLVLDLDNTLWGGVIGEERLFGIQLGHEGIGLAYREFQRAALSLSQRGIILAICSKNNPQDALAVLREHPDTLLHPDNFACMEINWEPKPQNLQRIAQTLNIGLDSLVFWDDSPLERELVSHQLPEVLVVDVPDDPSDYAAHLLDLDCFDTLTLTEADRQRGEMYQQQAHRQEYLAQPQSTSVEEFYASLDITVMIQTASQFDLPRITQLTQRTNQFNMTTRRYTETEIQTLASDRTYGLYALKLQDRFGDLGLVGAAIVRCELDGWHLENLLMSCRALGRNVEDAFFAYLVEQASYDGVKLNGYFKPSAKNALVRTFLQKYSLAPPQNWPGDVWDFVVPIACIQFPTWITFITEVNNVTA